MGRDSPAPSCTVPISTRHLRADSAPCAGYWEAVTPSLAPSPGYGRTTGETDASRHVMGRTRVMIVSVALRRRLALAAGAVLAAALLASPVAAAKPAKCQVMNTSTHRS